MQNIALLLSYDGTAYAGWQSQKNAVAIQDVLTSAICKLTGSPPLPRLEGCGRTDAGVHALGYVANFHTASSIPPDKFPYAINTLLPPDIRVTAARYMPDDFHARFSAVKKEYVYKLYTAPHADPFLLHRA